MPTSTWNRFLATFRGRKVRPTRDKETQTPVSLKSSKSLATKRPTRSTAGTTTPTTAPTTVPPKGATWRDYVKDWIVPVRYRWPLRHQFYSREQGIALAYRWPLLVGLAVFLSWDETAPITLVRIHGPSMLPTMAADGSDIWLCRRGPSWWSLCWSTLQRFWNDTEHAPHSSLHLHPYHSLKRGDLVGFGPPHSDSTSCKRVVGLPGDVVQRYGQYVHLYVHQDPTHWGLTWPVDETALDPSCPWDTTNVSHDPHGTLTVPPGHVWLEADCPALGLDSRQMGPVPMDWIHGKLVARLWPLSRSSWRQRPHPIPLDRETLVEHNVYREG